jgi:hypothetical protein
MTLLRTILALALTSAALPLAAAAQPVVVDLDTAVRCSAAFGIVASEQQRGVGTAKSDFPPLGERGREFFVQTGARLMDERGQSRGQVQQLLKSVVEQLQSSAAAARDPAAFRRELMTPCLALLDAALPNRLPPPR